MGDQDEKDTVWCLDASTGNVVWSFSYPRPLDPRYYEVGPSATPTIHQSSVFTLSKKATHLFRSPKSLLGVRASPKSLSTHSPAGDHGREMRDFPGAGQWAMPKGLWFVWSCASGDGDVARSSRGSSCQSHEFA